MSDYENYLKQLMLANPAAGTVNPTLYNAARTPLENQFTVARNQLQSSLPAGGQLNSALANLILQRGQAIGGLEANLLNQSQGNAMRLAPLMINQEQYNRNRNARNWAELGTGLGILAGLGLGFGQQE